MRTRVFVRCDRGVGGAVGRARCRARRRVGVRLCMLSVLLLGKWARASGRRIRKRMRRGV